MKNRVTGDTLSEKRPLMAGNAIFRVTFAVSPVTRG